MNEMPTTEVGLVAKIVEIGKEVGTPVGIIFIMVVTWQFLLIIKELAAFGIDVGKQFLARHFQHMDCIENELKEIVKTGNTNTERLSQTLSTVNASVTALAAITTQNVQEIKPMNTSLVKVEQALEHCKNFANNLKGRD